MNLEELLDNYYAPKKGNELLVKLIETKLNEESERIYTSSPINIDVATSGTAAYREFQHLLSGIRTTPFLSERLKMVNDVLLNPAKIIKNASIKKAFSSFFLIQELKDALEHVEEKVAGFQAESIVAQLLDGTKIADMKAADVSSEIFGKFQVKTISTKEVKGSFDEALTLYEKLQNQAYKFIIIYKAGNSVFDFYIFGLSFVDFIKNINFPKNFANEIKIKIGTDSKLRALQSKGLDVYYYLDNYNIIEESGVYYYLLPALDVDFKVGSSEVMSQIRNRQAEIEKTKDFIRKQSKTLQLLASDIPTFGTQFQLKTEYINAIYTEKEKYPDYEKIPTNSKYAGTLRLNDEAINKAKKEYQDKLVGDMLLVIKELNTASRRMNEYFSTLDRETGNKTMASLNSTQTTLSERFLSRKV